MLLVVLLIGMATALLVYGMVDTTSIALRRDRDTAAAFAEVKRALIGWSASRTPPTGGADARPGELPCPDMNNDGFEDGNCAAGAIGRVPWKTLGIAEPKDGWGETLWYVIAGPFRIWNVNNNPINSDTKGNLTVYQNSTATAITTEAVAVIFSPGAVLGAQDRSCTVGVNCTTTWQCTTSPASLTPKCNPANYLDLETVTGVNNATTNGPFISAPTSYTPPPGFNDKVMVITTADLIPVVEIRVARELLALLIDYSTRPGKSCTNNCYTGADEDFTNEEDDSAFRGWLPLCDADPDNWGALGITLPVWLTNNDWWKVIYYAVAPDKTEFYPGSSGTLTVDGAPAHVVLITPGPAPAGVTRPSLTIPRTPTAPSQCVLELPLSSAQATAYWQQYLSPNDPLNYDHSDNTYATPSSTAYARNRLYVIRP